MTTRAVIRERLEQYERQTQPLIEFFRKTATRLIEVDASSATPEAVFERIKRDLQSLR